MCRALIAVIVLVALVCRIEARPLDRIEKPPAGWQGQVFQPHFDFPREAQPETQPWRTISFRKEPERYLNALLAYALEGQDRTHWRLRANTVRRWYHVPWLGPDANGREFIHGLTRARDFAPGELAPGQTACRQNWALAFYNDIGGTVLRGIWGHGDRDPNLSALPFPEGTMAVKLVFTEAAATDDPKLEGAPTLEANIHAAPTSGSCAPAITLAGTPAPRTPRILRLIQVDLAVRESRARYKTGWVFGSYRYDGTMQGRDPWAKLTPLGLMWGNDPELSDGIAAAGTRPRQSIVFTAARGFGRGGRMNGVVDERGSACSSCHMAAQWPTVAPMTAPTAWVEAKCWFRNLDARYAFGFPPGTKAGCADPVALDSVRALDFSLQLAIALRNWSMERANGGKPTPTGIGTLKRTRDELTVNGLKSVALKR